MFWCISIVVIVCSNISGKLEEWRMGWSVPKGIETDDGYYEPNEAVRDFHRTDGNGWMWQILLLISFPFCWIYEKLRKKQ
jgi:hypothetical protein